MNLVKLVLLNGIFNAFSEKFVSLKFFYSILKIIVGGHYTHEKILIKSIE